MSVPVRVLVVDDQAVIRAGLRMILDHEPDLLVAGEAADGQQAVTAARRLRPDVVLMDVRMPGMDGLAATRALTAGPGTDRPAVLVLTTFRDEEYVLGAVRAGASGFLLKDAGADVLVDAVRTVHRGDSLVDPVVTRTLIARCLELEGAPPAPAGPAPPARWRTSLSVLSDRERETLVALAGGLSNRDLARQLYINETTVKSHISSMLGKLGLTSRVQAVVMAYESGLVIPGQPSAPPRP